MLKYELSDESKEFLDRFKLSEFVTTDRFATDQLTRLTAICEHCKALAHIVLTAVPQAKQRGIVLNQCQSIVFLCGSAILSTEGNIRKDKTA